MDIDAERLSFSKQAAEKIIAMGHYPATLEVTQDRRQALQNADIVITTILVGQTDVWRHDIEIPKKYGVDINVGDTRGPSGIFRFMRTLPVMLDIARDMEQLCPNALWLNYTNPMAMLCGALQRSTSIQVTGLCHSVQGTAHMLARWIGAPWEEITYTCAGINHQAWYLDYRWNGKDAYPLINEAIQTKPDIYQQEIVRNEMYLHLGYYVTESSGHNSEYNWWFRKRPDLIEKYCIDGTGWNPGEYAYILKEYQKNESTWKDQVKDWLCPRKTNEPWSAAENLQAILPMQFSVEMSSNSTEMCAMRIGLPILPQGACVEVPVVANRSGLHPRAVGALPPVCAMLTNLSSQIEELTIESTLAGDPTGIFHAIAHDPLTASVLSLAEIKQLVQEMFDQNQPYLPQFKSIKL